MTFRGPRVGQRDEVGEVDDVQESFLLGQVPAFGARRADSSLPTDNRVLSGRGFLSSAACLSRRMGLCALNSGDEPASSVRVVRRSSSRQNSALEELSRG